MLIPSRGSQSFSALCRHKCTQVHADRHKQIYLTFLYTCTHTLPPSQNTYPHLQRRRIRLHLQRTCTPLASCVLAVTSQGRQIWIAFLVCKRENGGPGNHEGHCGPYSKKGRHRQVSKPLYCPASCSDMTCRYPHDPRAQHPERTSQLPGLKVAFRELLGPRPAPHKGGSRRGLPGSSVYVVGTPVPSPEHLPTDGLGPERMFSPVTSHWAPQPSRGWQRMSLCDPMSVQRSVPQNVHECVYTSVCMRACAWGHVCATSPDCKDN